MSELHQKLMDAAYDRYQPNWSEEQFHDQLTPIEKLAVTTGNLNYQVENGGFMQWCDNDYGNEETAKYIIRQLTPIKDEAVQVVVNLLMEYLPQYRRYRRDLNPPSNGWGFNRDYIDIDPNDYFQGMDDRFYDINEKFMAAMEIELQKRNAE